MFVEEIEKEQELAKITIRPREFGKGRFRVIDGLSDGIHPLFQPKYQRAVVRPSPKRYAVYAGSFNPFHQGHLNIALQASAIFDQVEIVQGWNLEKEKPTCDLTKLNSLKRFKVGVCDGLLTDYISQNYIGCDVTLVRGLRNSLDLQAEINQSRYYQDLMPELKIAYLLCDREFEHVSSSAIRVLQKFSKEGEYIVT